MLRPELSGLSRRHWSLKPVTSRLTVMQSYQVCLLPVHLVLRIVLTAKLNIKPT